ncbi:MAG: hypothetical protein ACFFD2_04205 [Promethearchaeota archaeon]
MKKSKNKSIQKKINIIMLISTVIIIIISIFSVVSVFFIKNVQTNGKLYREAAGKNYDLVELVEEDINMILENDRQLQQLAFLYKQEFLLFNVTIGAMIAYNSTPIGFGTYMQKEVDTVAIQAALKIKQANALINETYAYEFGIFYLGMTAEENYTYIDPYIEDPFMNQSLDFYLIKDNYKLLKNDLHPLLRYWVNATYYEASNKSDPELLGINLLHWEGLMYNNTAVCGFFETKADKFAKRLVGKYLNNYGEDFFPEWYLWDNSYYDLLSKGEQYQAIAEIYEESSEIIGISLICLAIGAVIIAFAVSIIGRKYIWISVIIGSIITIIGMYMFVLGIQYSIQATQLAEWWWW